MTFSKIKYNLLIFCTIPVEMFRFNGTCAGEYAQQYNADGGQLK